MDYLETTKQKIKKAYFYLTENLNQAFDRAEKDLKEKKLLGFLLLVFLGVFTWLTTFQTAFLLSGFLAFLWFRWDSRIIASLALFSLATCPFLLIFQMEKSAEQMAIFAYYFLVMTVVLQILEYRRDDNLKVKLHD